MLRQEINLYTPFEKPIEQGYFTWKQYKVFNIAVVIIMVLIYQYDLLQNFKLKSNVRANQKVLSELQVKFNGLKSALPAEFFSGTIDNSVDHIKKTMLAQQEIVSILSNHTLFSEDLITLSRTITDGVWLTQINISKYGKNIALTGESLNTDVLHEFIKNCKNDPNFKLFDISLNEIKDKDTKDKKAEATFKIELVKKS